VDLPHPLEEEYLEAFAMYERSSYFKKTRAEFCHIPEEHQLQYDIDNFMVSININSLHKFSSCWETASKGRDLFDVKPFFTNNENRMKLLCSNPYFVFLDSPEISQERLRTLLDQTFPAMKGLKSVFGKSHHLDTHTLVQNLLWAGIDVVRVGRFGLKSPLNRFLPLLQEVALPQVNH
jgi:hypothetical protein